MIKNLDELIENVKNEGYKVKVEYPKRPEGYKRENYVYDENKSVKWNREHREKLEKEYSDSLKAYLKRSTDLELQFKEDLITLEMKRYKINKDQANLVYKRAWEDGHSEGYEEVINQVELELQFLSDFNKLA